VTEDPLWPRASDWLAVARPTPTGPARSLGVVGVPLARTSISPSGADQTPAAVRAALRRFSTYHAGLDVDLESVVAVDYGDLDVADLDGYTALHAVMAGLDGVPESDLLAILGGDNAITRPAVRALAPRLRDVGLLTVDAHHDVRGFHAGPTNGTPVRGLIDDGLPGRQIIQIGIGDLSNSRAYRSYCADQGITVVGARDAASEGVGACVRRHLARLAQTCERVYVDLDVDVVDRVFVPGCPGARPGGLSPRDLLDAAAEAGRCSAVVAVDIVEVDATRDLLGMTVDLAAMCLLSVAAGLAARA
jgi:formiminoglutamase